MQSYHATFALFVVFIGNSAVGNTLTGFADAGGSTFEANTSDNNLGAPGEAWRTNFIR